MTPAPSRLPVVGLFVTCLVDLVRPSVGFAAVALLERAGCRVRVPEAQTCCGQPAFNSGDTPAARPIAEGVIRAFEGFDYVVAPSGSCAGMIKKHFPEIFAGDAAWAPRAEALADKTHELTAFLADVMNYRPDGVRYDGVATYHDSCSGLREMGVKRQPRALLDAVEGLAVAESPESETCCGFGGLFCVKYPDVSGAIVDKKVDAVLATGADTLLAGDMGCLMNMAGRLSRRGAPVCVRHVAEVLVGDAATPPIAQGADPRTPPKDGD
jgi:L-lactate dehydrogenase complex protein LldE